jgi:hypothetical protein
VTKNVDQLLDEARACAAGALLVDIRPAAVATLQHMGFRNATDVTGGFQSGRRRDCPSGKGRPGIVT